MPECAVVSSVDQHSDRRPLAKLAGHVADRLASDDMQLLLALAAGGALNPAIFERTVAAVRHGLPYASLAALHAMQPWSPWRNTTRSGPLTAPAVPGSPSPGSTRCGVRGEQPEMLSMGPQSARSGAVTRHRPGATVPGRRPESSCRRALSRGAALAGTRQARHACAAATRPGQAEAALELSQLAADLGRFPKAQCLAGEAAALGASDPWLACRARLQDLDVQYYQTHYVEADRGYVSIAGECLAAGWQIDYAHVRVMQGLLATQQGNLPQAHEHLAAAMVFYRAEEALYYVGVCLRAMAMLWRRQGRFAEAAAEAHAALDMFQGWETCRG